MQVPKVYPPNDIDNDFRQISVLSQMAKVLETMQLKLSKGDLKIKHNQHAFTPGRSTVSALASITQNLFNKTENSRDGRMGIHAPFIDFRKAFDLVNHGVVTLISILMLISARPVHERPLWMFAWHLLHLQLLHQLVFHS